jgi:hypothetical protein
VLSARLGTLSLAVTASIAATALGCRDEHALPTRLADGTTARTVAIAFEGLTVPVFETRLRRSHAVRDDCGPSGVRMSVVERVGVVGSSLTALSPAGTLHGCDGTQVGTGTWCGHAFGRLHDGRLLDPRLSLTCRDADDQPIGFGWIVPGRGTAYVVVHHGSYAEMYRVEDRVPVRVTTREVSIEGAEAHFDLTEHARDGRLLATREVRAQVSG